jgi:hypothetical protein
MNRPTLRPTRRRVVIVLGVLAVLVAAVAVVGVLGSRSLTAARDDLDAATTDASELKDALIAGDTERSRAELSSLQSRARSADSELDSKILSLAAKAPFIGRNVDAVRAVASAVRTVADDGLPPIVTVAGSFNAKTFNPTDGRLDVTAMKALAPNLIAAAAAIDQADNHLQSIDADSLLGRLREPVLEAQQKLGDAQRVAARASLASQIVPEMLSGKHTYLLMFENNAEIRATGGLPGAYAILKVDNGKVTISSQGTGGSLGDLDRAAAQISPEEETLFSDLLVTDFRDVNFTPDFPRAASIAAAILDQERDTSIDGVLSLDPVTLSYLLKGIGPVTLADGTQLTSDNAVDVLLNGVYVDYPNPDAQDAVFASTTQSIFDRVISGAGDPTTLLEALTRAATERRIGVWSKDPAVTQKLAGTPLARAVRTGEAARTDVGFYLNDATGAKMQYYLRFDLNGTSVACSDRGVQRFTTEQTLRSTAPADSASLPVAIQGPGFGAQPGSMLMNLYVYGPTGGTIDDVTIDGETTDYTPATFEGRPVAIVTVQVDPGSTVKVGSTITTAAGADGPVHVTSTPSIVPGPSAQTWASSC